MDAILYIEKLIEARKKYKDGTEIGYPFKVKGELYIDFHNKVIKSMYGSGVIYDYKTDKWAEIKEW